MPTNPYTAFKSTLSSALTNSHRGSAKDRRYSASSASLYRNQDSKRNDHTSSSSPGHTDIPSFADRGRASTEPIIAARAASTSSFDPTTTSSVPDPLSLVDFGIGTSPNHTFLHSLSSRRYHWSLPHKSKTAKARPRLDRKRSSPAVDHENSPLKDMTLDIENDVPTSLKRHTSDVRIEREDETEGWGSTKNDNEPSAQSSLRRHPVEKYVIVDGRRVADPWATYELVQETFPPGVQTLPGSDHTTVRCMMAGGNVGWRMHHGVV